MEQSDYKLTTLTCPLDKKIFSSTLSYTKCDLHEFGWLRDVNELEPTLLKTCIRVLITYDMTYLTLTKRRSFHTHFH